MGCYQKILLLGLIMMFRCEPVPRIFEESGSGMEEENGSGTEIMPEAEPEEETNIFINADIDPQCFPFCNLPGYDGQEIFLHDGPISFAEPGPEDLSINTDIDPLCFPFCNIPQNDGPISFAEPGPDSPQFWIPEPDPNFGFF